MASSFCVCSSGKVGEAGERDPERLRSARDNQLVRFLLPLVVFA